MARNLVSQGIDDQRMIVDQEHLQAQGALHYTLTSVPDFVGPSGGSTGEVAEELPVNALGPRELEILRLAARGMRNKR